MARTICAAKPLVAKLDELLRESRSKKNPALWLYEQDARSIIFRLEGLFRLLHRIEKNEQLRKWKKTFKKLEDALGAIDHYTALHDGLPKKAPLILKVYFLKKKEKSLSKLNKRLQKNNFYTEFLKDLARDFKSDMNAPGFAKKTTDVLQQELKECEQYFSKFKNGFNDMETQVHELRRKLRWISIYAQALQGLL